MCQVNALPKLNKNSGSSSGGGDDENKSSKYQFLIT
jgi:hypothetical protein